MWPFLILGALALVALLFLAGRYVLRAIDGGKPGWGNPRAEGVYCPHAKGELGDRGVPGEEDPK